MSESLMCLEIINAMHEVARDVDLVVNKKKS